MRLAPRLFLAFAFLGTVTTAGLGLVVRQDRARAETRRFHAEVTRACTQVVDEISRQADRDDRLVRSACQSGELVDRTLVALEAGELDEQRVRFAALVPQTRSAFDLDELMLVANGGDLVGVDPKSLLGLKKSEVERSLTTAAGPLLRLRGESSAKEAALVSRCTKRGRNGLLVGLVGTRHLDPLIGRLGNTLALSIRIGRGETFATAPLETSCEFKDASGKVLPISVQKSTDELTRSLHEIDAAVLLAWLASSLLSLLVASLFARSLGKPLTSLAVEARKVASGEAQPIRATGSGEVRELADSFDKMLGDLSSTRRRLAAASRIAAWREVARRVAHEVKNPLAPIQAAVETLRRLRARQDPAFDEYFDEASSTVLTEVRRISTIVTEFTRFARLPAPRPEEVNMGEIVQHVVSLQAARAPNVRFHVAGPSPALRADRDQVIQVLTNLVQNAAESAETASDALVSIHTSEEDSTVHVTVSDNGAGIAEGIRERLFEPYATTKATGTGLGLAIAQRVALDHGGELAYLGPFEKQRGAVFRLTLPVEGPPPASDGAPSGPRG